MGFMEKNINIFLLILVLVVAGALAGSSVYYQDSFDKLTGTQENTAEDLSECETDLESYKFNLNKTLRSLNTTSQDIRRYDELYTTKSEELKTTQSELEDTSTTLKETKINLQEETSLKNKYKKDYHDQLDINRGLEEDNTILTAQKRQVETELTSYKSKVSVADNCIEDFLQDYAEGTTLTAALREDLDDCRP
jgi:chromosome segregation ATPase